MRQRNVKRIVQSVSQHMSSLEQRNAKLVPDMPMADSTKSPRISAIELQQVRTLLRDAEKHVARDPAEAERLLIQALTLKPDMPEVQAMLARVYLQTSRPQKAEAVYRELIHSIGSKPSLHANLGLACYRQEKYEDACEAYREAMELEPDVPERKYDLGRAYMAAGKFDQAVTCLEEAATRITRDTKLLGLIAQCYTQLHDREHLEETYRKINRLEPYNEDVKQKLAKLVG